MKNFKNEKPKNRLEKFLKEELVYNMEQDVLMKEDFLQFQN
jgi:hypothetical protein